VAVEEKKKKPKIIKKEEKLGPVFVVLRTS